MKPDTPSLINPLCIQSLEHTDTGLKCADYIVDKRLRVLGRAGGHVIWIRVGLLLLVEVNRLIFRVVVVDLGVSSNTDRK